MNKKNKIVINFKSSSCTVGADVLPLIDALSHEGWAVSLRKMPPDVGYSDITTGERKFPGYWCCEATYMRKDKTVATPTGATSDDPLLLVNEMARRCRKNTEDIKCPTSSLFLEKKHD